MMLAKMASRTLKVLFSLVALFVGSFLKSAHRPLPASMSPERSSLLFTVLMLGAEYGPSKIRWGPGGSKGPDRPARPCMRLLGFRYGKTCLRLDECMKASRRRRRPYSCS